MIFVCEEWVLTCIRMFFTKSCCVNEIIAVCFSNDADVFKYLSKSL